MLFQSPLPLVVLVLVPCLLLLISSVLLVLVLVSCWLLREFDLLSSTMILEPSLMIAFSIIYGYFEIAAKEGDMAGLGQFVS